MRDEPVKEAADGMDKDADRMESRIDELEEDIDEAKDASKLTAEQADPDAAAPAEDIAGDWEGQARTDEDPSGAPDQEHPAAESGDES